MEKWLIWCNLNKEQDALEDTFEGHCVSIRGDTPHEKRLDMEKSWREGDVPIMISKPSVFGFGMNWQHCHNVVFVGLSDSFEEYYQSVRRCWRFGQKEQVKVYVITSEKEGAVVKNIKRKERDFEAMLHGMISATQEITKKNIKETSREIEKYMTGVDTGNGWEMRLGDNVEHIKSIDDNSIGYTIFSPPFSSLYTYSNSERDMGNCRTDQEFFDHFSFLAPELFRTLKPGRLMSVHCMNLPTSKQNHGYIGIRDFRGDLIRIFQKAGFIYHSEVVIWKDPVTAMQRTKALGLLHKQIVKDSCMGRQGVPDYLVTMRKPGENKNPVHGELDHFCGDMTTFKSDGRLSIDIWQKYASPIWMDINPSNTLQHRSAREEKDEKHICPLQLDVIHRALQLWTNPNDIVFSPFAGIGSEGYESVKMDRKFIGIELKKSYFDQAIANLKNADIERASQSLFDEVN